MKDLDLSFLAQRLDNQDPDHMAIHKNGRLVELAEGDMDKTPEVGPTYLESFPRRFPSPLGGISRRAFTQERVPLEDALGPARRCWQDRADSLSWSRVG